MSNTDGEDAKLQKGKFYWISIKQYDDGSQHAIRIADKWSVAQWDGHSFEEMNEMYRPEDVVKIGQIIPTQEELASLREQLAKREEVIRELIPIAEWGVPGFSQRLWNVTGDSSIVEMNKVNAVINKAKSLITKDK